MQQRIKCCNPTIVNKDTLMTEDFMFMDKDIIREWCNCVKKNICLQIIDLLNNKKLDEAERLISWMQEV